MKKELENTLIARWPYWFNADGDIRHTLMSSGFAHGDGWFEILWRLCEELEPVVREFERATGSKFEILQVKEKLGGLRVHANQTDDAYVSISKPQNRNPFEPARFAVRQELRVILV